MKSQTLSLATWLLGMLLAAGCQKPAPVELHDARESEVSDVQPLPEGSHEPDTTGLIASDRDRYLAELVVAGIRYDAPGDSHTVDLARGIFRDRTRPIIVSERRIGYHTVDVGNLFIDGLPLNKLPLRLRVGVPGFPSDTAAGPYYSLVKRDGIGGRGFTYFGGHRYEWTNSGSNIVIDINATSAREIRVTSPTPQHVVSIRRGLHVEWTGGEEFIYLIVSVRATGDQRPILRMKLRKVRDRVFIPPKILHMLPLGRSSQFVFSFISHVRTEASLSNYPDKVLVYSASIHNLLLTVQR